MFKKACPDLEEYADVVTSYVSWCEDMRTETKTVTLYDIDKGGGQERQVSIQKQTWRPVRFQQHQICLAKAAADHV